MPNEEPIDFSAVVDRWRQDLELEQSLGDLGIGDMEADVWIALAEAEREAGVSRSSLRAWYRSGQIPSRLVNGPHGLQRLVPLTAVVERARRSGRVPGRVDRPERVRKSEEAPTMPSPDAVVRLAELASSQATERAAAAEARAAAAEQALHQALERAAAAEVELRLVRERLQRLEEGRPDLQG